MGWFCYFDDVLSMMGKERGRLWMDGVLEVGIRCLEEVVS